MKSNRIIVLIILGFFFAFSSIISINLSLNNSEFCSDNGNLKISAVSGKIHIDGNSGWATFRAAGNCTGEGTYSEPYVIEDLVIDGGGSGSCIKIENSNVYFKIENCTVYNGGGDVPDPLFGPNPISHAGDAGIHLYNVTHALLFNNTCNDSDLTLQSRFYGILLLNSYNNTITRNLVTQSQFVGIGGIIVSMSNNNVLTENIVNDGEIALIQSNNSIVSGNIMNVDSVDGLLLIYCINTTVTGNNITNRALGELEAGIKLIHSDYNNISKNIAKQRIDCVGIKNNTISGNIIENNNYGPGINLYSCYNNTIEENTINDNTGEGIRIRDSDCNLILRNNLTNNTVGISFQYYSPPSYFSHDDYNIVLGNTITNNRQYGIWFQEDSSFNLIFNNTFIGNSIHAVDNGTGNQWNSPYKIIYTYKGTNYTNYFGNYWDNYTGNDANNDGIGDTAFILNVVIDNYPLMEPIENYIFIGIYESPEATEKGIPGYNIFILLGIVSIASILISKKVKKS
ncbi:MAG: NosD domain-containing protein [Promethearchaeota archaeon]